MIRKKKVNSARILNQPLDFPFTSLSLSICSFLFFPPFFLLLFFIFLLRATTSAIVLHCILEEAMPALPALLNPDVLSAPEVKVSVLVESLARLHERSPDQALHDFLAFIFRAGGAEAFSIPVEAFQDQSSVSSTLETLFSTFQGLTLPSSDLTGEYPLGKKGKPGRRATERFLDIIDRFIRTLHSKGELWDDPSFAEDDDDTSKMDDHQYFLPQLEEWLVPLTR